LVAPTLTVQVGPLNSVADSLTLARLLVALPVDRPAGPQPEQENPMTHTVTPDDIPTSVTRLIYTDPAGCVLSQNQAAAMFTHYWPAIEQHIREQIAAEITEAATARLEAIDELDRRPSDQRRYQEWMDAAQVARGAEVSW